MYWLLSDEKQEALRKTVDELVHELSLITDNPQLDQLFPYVGRKDRRKAEKVLEIICSDDQVIIEPFAGSGTFVYAAANTNKEIKANEWEPYANRMAKAPWRIPNEAELVDALSQLIARVESRLNYYYATVCDCGHNHVLDSLFFDRDPLSYTTIAIHERLGPNGENITYRLKYKCPICGRQEKFFNQRDYDHLVELDAIVLSEKYRNLFDAPLIENSRINLSGAFTVYGHLFPHRSRLVLAELWQGIQDITCDSKVRMFLEDAFLAIIPQAKYKDYRSKSQDLHCPPEKLREVNIWFRFREKVNSRFIGLSNYSFSTNTPDFENKISCLDFRQFINNIDPNSADVIFTDPPWTDGNAYFEKAQLYHPWLNFNLRSDNDRLENEFVVTDAPSRRATHTIQRWWKDIDDLFESSQRVLKDDGLLVLFFRPIPASKWLHNLNLLKLHARKNGFEPILSIDVGSSDPSMRIQQSASYVFATDIIFLFYKLPNNIRRTFVDIEDIDQIVFQVAEELQELKRAPFLYSEWRNNLSNKLIEKNLSQLNAPKWESKLKGLFETYCDTVAPGLFLPKPLTPFSGQIFDIPAIERLFTYIPDVVTELTEVNNIFSYDSFLLKLAEFVENGTKALINQLQDVNIRQLLELYATPSDGGRYFEKKLIPSLPNGIRNVLEMDPYDFEAFVGNLLIAQGFTNVVLAGRSGDRGVDVIAVDPQGLSTVVQCKRYIGSVSSTPIQRLHSFAITRGANRKMLFTTSHFTPQAREEANFTNTELVDGAALEIMIATYLPNFLN